MQGYIKDHRRELKSDIWQMPPIYHRVWQYIKYMANHQENEIPMRDGSKMLIKEGQHLTSVRNIAQNIGWYERGIFKEPNPKTVQAVLNWLENSNMIYTEKSNRKYTLITVVNWGFYQGEKETKVTESNNVKVTERQQSMDINNNDKNEKKEYTSEFDSFWSSYPRKVDKKGAFEKFKQAAKRHDVELIIKGAEDYAKECKVKKTEKQYIKHPKTFLHNDSFLNEFEINIGTHQKQNNLNSNRRDLVRPKEEDFIF